MIASWRICRAPYADLSGRGAALVGGRWNSAGRAVVYTAGEPALAVLEVRVHLDLPPDLLPADYMLLTVEGPADAPVERVEALPDDPVGFGDRWIAEGRSAVLDVPSILVPESRNLLINPAHPAAGGFRITAQRPFRFDHRLWMGR